MAERVPAYEGNEPYVFVSYAHKNSRQVLEIINTLFDNKYRVWYDEGIAPGSEWPKNIETHLQGADAVIACVSKESLASPNCENEVVNSNPDERKVLQLSLDGSKHKLLSDCASVKNADEIISHLEDRFIGDGETGYHTDIGTSGEKNWWTSLIVLAVGLIAALAVGIYGLNDGWFDSYLPGLQKTEEITQQPNEEKLVEVDNLITQAVAQQTNEELTKPIEFESEETKEMLLKIMGYDGPTADELTYYNLTMMNINELWLDNCNDELLSLMKYFRNLETINIKGGEISSLEPLCSCADLKTVSLTYFVFPVDIPSDRQFKVMFIN